MVSIDAFFGALPDAGGAAASPTCVTTWIAAGDLKIDLAFRMDGLSGVMCLIITFIGFLIHVYSAGYMADEPDYARFFAYLNLFCGAMLVLVLGDNLPVMFIGWEGVGLCSYLLIGFWYSSTANADAGKKAFIINRIGDFGFLIGMFLLFQYTGLAQRSRTSPRPRRRAGRSCSHAVAGRSRSRSGRRCSCSSARPASRRRFRSTSGCRTPWPARRRSRPSSTPRRW